MGRVEDAVQHVPVIQRDVAEIKQDVHDGREEMRGTRKVLMGFLATFAFTGISIVVALISVFGTQS